MSVCWFLGMTGVHQSHDLTGTLWLETVDGGEKQQQLVTLCYGCFMFRHFKQIWGETGVAQSTWRFPMSCQVRQTGCWTRGGWWRACHASCWTSPWVWPAGACAPPHQSSRPSEQSPASVWSNSVGSSPPALHTRETDAHTQSARITLQSFFTLMTDRLHLHPSCCCLSPPSPALPCPAPHWSETQWETVGLSYNVPMLNSQNRAAVGRRWGWSSLI